MDNDQTIYKNKTLTHNLYQTAQEAYPLSTVTSLGSQLTIYKSKLRSQTTICINQSRKPNNNPCKQWAQNGQNLFNN